MNKMDDPTVLQVAGHTVATHVVSNIQKASADTGVSFSYLMAQAGKESSFQTDAGSQSSSAAGLFQFTRNTWLSMVKRHGAAHGLGDLAQAIHRGAKGEYTVDDAQTRQHILDLRRDPQLSAVMAGEYAKDNKSRLEKALGRPVDSTDLYLAHFLGPSGAARVLKAKEKSPDMPAAEVVPKAANNNPAIFFDSNHTPKSVAEVYERIHHTIERPMAQYASLEQTPSEDSGTRHSDHVGKVASASRKTDLKWPFETGQWPPKPFPVVASAAGTDTDSAVEGEQTETVALASTDDAGSWQSADRVSQPMPPPLPGTKETAKADDSAFGKLLHSVKGLWGRYT